MDQQILSSTKKILGLAPEDTTFDQDVLTFINSAFSTLYDLGVGPEAGFRVVDDEAEWPDFIDNTPDLDRVKTYVYLQVRLAFDPPATSFHIKAVQDQIAEQTWRLSASRESIAWVDPNPPMEVVE